MFMNKAAKENLILYQMDVKTAYLGYMHQLIMKFTWNSQRGMM